MVITVIKMSFKKHSPIEKYYRGYKYFDQTKFQNDLNEKLSEGISNYEPFQTTFIEVLNTHVPLKNKFLRANHVLYITETLRKATMHRSQPETKYLKTKTQTDLKLYRKLKNFCSKLHRRERRKYYESLDIKNALDNEEFWKTIRPFLFDKNTVFSPISIEKITKLYLMTLIFLKSFFKILLDHSMSNQMNII